MSQAPDTHVEESLDFDFEFDLSSDQETEIPERRASPRSRPKRFSIKGFVRKKIDFLVKKVGSSWLGLSCLALVIVSALILLWFSLVMRAQDLGRNFELVAELTELRSHFSELIAKLSHDDINKLRSRVSSAEESIFSDYGRLAAWLNHEAELAAHHKFNIRYTMADAIPTNIKGVAELPIELQVTATDSGHGGAYLALLEFIKSMVDDQWHLQIASAAMDSEGDGVTLLAFVIRVWVRDEKSVGNTAADEEFIQ